MKQLMIAAGICGVLLTGSASAIEGTLDLSAKSTNISGSIGTHTPGLFANGNWLHSSHDGDLLGAAVGYNIKVGPITLSPAGKLAYVNPENGKSGLVLAPVIGAGYSLNSMWGIFGSLSYAPKLLTDHLNSYQDISAGVEFAPFSMASFRLGYQHVTLNNRGSSKNNALTDGAFISASVNF